MENLTNGIKQDSSALVPAEQVLADLRSDGYAHGIAWDYYYQHYASLEEQRMMRKYDLHRNRACAIVWGIYMLLIAGITILRFIN